MSTTQEYSSKFITPDQYFEDQEVMKTVFDGYDEKNLIFAMLWRGGMKKEHTKRDEFHHWEFDTLFQLGTVASATGVGAGVTVDVTLASANHDNGGKNSGFPVKTLVKVKTSGGEIDARVVAKDQSTDNAHVISLKPLDSSVDLGVAIAADDLIIDVSTAKGDGAAWTEGLVRKKNKIKHSIQIFDRKGTIDLGEASNTQKVEVPTPSGGKSMHYYNQKYVDTLLELQMRIGNQLMVGGYSEDFNDEDEGTKVHMSKSLDYIIKDQGFTQPVSGSIALADLDAIVDKMAVENVDSRVDILPGDQLSRDIDKLVKGEYDNGAIDFADWGIGSKTEKKVDFNIDGFKYGDFDFAKLKSIREFSYKGRNYTGNQWRKTGFIIPHGTMSDAKTGEQIPRMCIRYRKSENDNRLFKKILRDERHVGKDKNEIIYQAEMGLQGIGARQFIKIK